MVHHYRYGTLMVVGTVGPRDTGHTSQVTSGEHFNILQDQLQSELVTVMLCSQQKRESPYKIILLKSEYFDTPLCTQLGKPFIVIKKKLDGQILSWTAELQHMILQQADKGGQPAPISLLSLRQCVVGSTVGLYILGSCRRVVSTYTLVLTLPCGLLSCGYHAEEQ